MSIIRCLRGWEWEQPPFPNVSTSNSTLSTESWWRLQRWQYITPELTHSQQVPQMKTFWALVRIECPLLRIALSSHSSPFFNGQYEYFLEWFQLNRFTSFVFQLPTVAVCFKIIPLLLVLLVLSPSKLLIVSKLYFLIITPCR